MHDGSSSLRGHTKYSLFYGDAPGALPLNYQTRCIALHFAALDLSITIYYVWRMAHLVTRKGKYVSLEESYRDERGRPRKRILKYFGVLGSIDWHATLLGTDRGVDWWAIEQEQLARMNAEDAEQKSKEAALHAAYGLTVGPTDPVPQEPVSAHDTEVVPTETVSESAETSDSESNASSEADSSSDASSEGSAE